MPVGRRREAIASVASNALRGTLRPLGPLVQEVHDALRSVPSPPSEISVTFGVQLSQDLKLGIVNGNGQAHLTVTATWNPPTLSEPAAATPQPRTPVLLRHRGLCKGVVRRADPQSDLLLRKVDRAAADRP
ncbi:hypothetical protein OG520_39095 [Streptomyces sp. NBC_00984]|uniref:CU044_2847 family protein n=1 Tax=Streptomyces sp. NBC_00984 TaxID=2903700 RepID=UPI00386C3EEB|nr:hypothetical protein OG520_39095 [Streptomyces sp. NBC_00984]